MSRRPPARRMTARQGNLVLATRKGSVRIPGRGTLLARMTSAGIPVASSCSGQGACGRCVVRVLEGAGALSPPTAREQAVLARNHAAPDERLSCQCRVVEPSEVVHVSTGYW